MEEIILFRLFIWLQKIFIFSNTIPEKTWETVYLILLPWTNTQKNDLIESKKMICLNDFLWFKEMICSNETKFVWFKQNIFEPNKYLFESN